MHAYSHSRRVRRSPYHGSFTALTPLITSEVGIVLFYRL